MKKRVVTLLILVLGFSLLYIGLDFFQLTAYVQKARLTKLLSFLIVILLIVPPTIVFQTIVNSRYLSPSIIGMDAVYVLIQSLIYFMGYHYLSQLMNHSLILFLIQIGLMLSICYLSLYLAKINWLSTVNESIWLMIGMIFGTVLRNLSTFFQVLMDPNEYLALQSRLFASFQSVSKELLGIAFIIAILSNAYFFYKRYLLDVYHLGKTTALTLGVDIQKETKRLLLLIVLMLGTATAFVGPLTFLGFMVANITYYLTPKHHHLERLTIGILFGLVMILSGQLLIERVLNLQFNLNIMIEGIGGLMFFLLLFKKERVLK
ncbi:MAG TPA: iron chelate uptake ABC transporter family permease subunit [Globicatella sulfidifaciens]|uniref:Iron chelate uptake ABC transporter family permease subunit n=1 Tax=Globicatella sulfidifaciens TaxID=136093 RepID=A0A7X8C3R2_9LACT|nr:iron chelate uptake ABC transporter family permease subunit [Globicatella sulfidifaciens]NLJ18293.1 iron chelate uptake ABC transporter family permease subunit [Globicatella sulfidifaciens]HJF16695.1 iron chelate uptake ABC transporter family permease subunit [Globicatella sulfidifaciens]